MKTLELINKNIENTRVTAEVVVPFDYKNAFKRKMKQEGFRISWNSSSKSWTVSQTCRTSEEASAKLNIVLNYIEMKNKRINKGTAVKNGRVDLAVEDFYRRERIEEDFRVYCEDMGAYTKAEQDKLRKEYF